MRTGVRGRKPTDRPTHEGAPIRWQRRLSATGCNGDTGRGGGDGDRGESQRRGLTDITIHRRGYGCVGGRSSQLGARSGRRRPWGGDGDVRENRRRGVYASTLHRHGSGHVSGRPSEREACTGQRRPRGHRNWENIARGGGGRNPQERARGEVPSQRRDGGEGPPRTVARA